MFTLTTIDPLADSRWDQLISTRNSSIFHSPAWIHTLKKTYGFDIKANLLLDPSLENMDASPLAGLLFCKLSDIRGNRISSLPFCDYIDPLVGSVGHWEMLVNPLVNLGLPIKIRPLHTDVVAEDQRFEKINQARWHGLDLSLSCDELWNNLAGSVRTSIRKAMKNNVEIRVATSEDELQHFFHLHVGVRKNKYRMVAQPFSFFQNIWREIISKGNGRLYLATYQDQVIAATMFLHWKDVLYYKFNASDPDMLWLNPNEYLLWEGINYAKELGCQQLDFGLSDWDQDGLIFYKRKFASTEKAIQFFQHIPDEPAENFKTQNGQVNDVGALLPQLTDLFTDESVPQEIAEKAGALLYRYFA